jgi:glycosyltransferase involved in cell wall biosynthesis
MTTGILISHPTKQGNVYERAYAAQCTGLRCRYLTGFYGAHVPAWLRLMGALSVANRRRLDDFIKKRSHPQLASSNVVTVSSPLLEVWKMQFGAKGHFQEGCHDRAVARWLRTDSETASFRVFHGFQGSCTRSLKAARKRGLITLLEITLPPIHNRDLQQAPVNGGFRQALMVENQRRGRQAVTEAGSADYVIIQSDFSRVFLEEAGVPADRIVVVDLGVDVEEFQPPLKKKPSEKLRLFFAGQIGYRKGFDILANALAKIDSIDLELIAVGHVVDDVGRRSLSSDPRISYRGVVSAADLVRGYQEADALVIPSRAEGGCNVVMEALACGLPCIVTEGAVSVIQSGVNGQILPNGDADALATCLREAASNRDRLGAMSEAARQTALDHSWARFYEQLGALYRRLQS